MTNITKPNPHLLLRMDAHHRLMISLCISASVFLLTFRTNSAASVTLLTWMSFSISAILMMWAAILSSHPREVRRIARLQDSSRTMIFAFVIVASMVSLLAVYLLLTSAKAHAANSSKNILLAVATVLVAWWLLHTIFTMRYAHLYYNTEKDDGTPGKGGGLQFPNETEPDYLDFVYFAFVIGMTFQVSDVEISSKNIRRLAWLHGLLSFAFNTAIVALSINVISGLISQ